MASPEVARGAAPLRAPRSSSPWAVGPVRQGAGMACAAGAVELSQHGTASQHNTYAAPRVGMHRA
eukprot:5059525-Pyramimonas_sp.AAC.1